ncbi:Uncharacterised protein [Mycolicibacterium vanbaalenii]|uniref:Secreted protein n=1 Tax=Mycolicibacterium vanbaalenii TaxID=110539 RepID=A0A5S9Q1D8_MYCVN|nr:hypothetical protein [Mycolicibacterium vanbaalenii]CAA0110702.1 Uncharacterised protein [Mycolicibacterium vanbaalenii]
MFGIRTHCLVLVLVVLLMVASPVSSAEPGQNGVAPSLPPFTPYPSDWSPDYTVFPYDVWRSRVTPEQITAQRESCQWFNARYDQLRQQALGFQHFLGDQHDDWSATGVREAGDVVAANLDQSAAFLNPRAHTLFIVNYPDLSDYSPLFHGDSIYRLWYQLTQISDKISRRLPSGQISANTATLNVYGRAIRDSGVCEGA